MEHRTPPTRSYPAANGPAWPHRWSVTPRQACGGVRRAAYAAALAVAVGSVWSYARVTQAESAGVFVAAGGRLEVPLVVPDVRPSDVAFRLAWPPR